MRADGAPRAGSSQILHTRDKTRVNNPRQVDNLPHKPR